MSARSRAVAVGALAFLVRRTFLNAVRRRLSRLKEPRYLVATCIGAAYFYFYFVRALLPRSGRGWTASRSQAMPLELRSLLLLGGSIVLAVLATQAWLFCILYTSPSPRD